LTVLLNLVSSRVVLWRDRVGFTSQRALLVWNGRQSMQVRFGTRRILHALMLATVIAAVTGGGAMAAATGHLLETGSSLLYPLFNLWVPAFQKTHPHVEITTQSTGSGTGIAQSVSGLAQLGASDAYLSNALMKKSPGMLNIPLAISSQMINFNIPGLNDVHLKLSGPVLAGIYSGHITKWNDPAITKLNPGVKLPAATIVPVHRTDGSGDTFIFTQYLSASTPSWATTQAYGTTISWPAVAGNLGAEGNPGMVNAIKGTPYSIAYIGISFKNAIQQNNLGTAMLKNKAGNFVLPSNETVQAAANADVAQTPADERISLIFAPGANSYPIINYEYVMVKQTQPSQGMASDLRDFLHWAVQADGGNSPTFLDKVNFVALPASVRKLSEAQIAKISS
jgi:phosphate transport system substrate-binding protein